MGPHSIEGTAGRGAGRALIPFGVLAFLATVLSCGDGSPVGIDTANLELVLVQGDHQGGLPEATLPITLQVKAQTTGNGSPVEDARVEWVLLEGRGGGLSPAVSRTDSLGLASAQLTLGPDLGRYRVQAAVKGSSSPPVEFTAEALREPLLTEVPTGPLSPGDLITIGGSHFSTNPLDNVVTFSRIRAEVVTAGPDELQVRVPLCLLARAYDLRVQIGTLATEARSVVVQGVPEAAALGVGEDMILQGPAGSGCVHLPAGGNSLYLVVPHSTAEVTGAEYGFSFVTVTDDGLPLASSGAPFRAPEAWRARVSVPPLIHPVLADEARIAAQDRWDERLRRAEAGFLLRRSSEDPIPAGRVGAARAAAEEIQASPATPVGVQASSAAPVGAHASPATPVVPEVGDKRTFKVLNGNDRLEKVSARVRYVSERAVLYMDENVPAGGFTDGDLAELAYEFDSAIHPVVTTAFGEESDLDGNERVVILFTPAVNRLTQAGSEGHLDGYFYGLDLLRGRSGSNEGEIFYAMVPDPQGEEGPAIGRFSVLQVIPAVLAHEFEHMVHFHRRMVLGGAQAGESLWLSEALAQMAEDLVGQAYQGASNLAKAAQYQSGNWARARRFLENPSQVSVLASLSPGTLAERGAGWLLLKQLSGAPGREGLLQALVSSTLTGVENLTTRAGQPWADLVADWVGALFLDGTGVPVRPGLGVAGVNLRMVLAESDGSYPLNALPAGGVSAVFSGTLWSSAPEYFIITPPMGGVTLSAGGPLGARPDGAMGLRTLLVRLR